MNYSKALEFFMENNIYLNDSQIKSLQEFYKPVISDEKKERFLDKIKNIKSGADVIKYGGNEKQIKEFIIKNEADLVTVINELEKSPKELQRESKTAAIIHVIVQLISLPLIFVFGIGMIVSLVDLVLLYIDIFKMDHDLVNLSDSIKESNKLKSRLVELKSKTKDKETQDRIEKLIERIEDAEVEVTGELNKRNK